MEERLTERFSGDVAPLPEVPNTPAALFEAMPPAVEEPAMGVAAAPLVPGPVVDAAPPTRRGWPKYVAIGAAALLVGVGIGYLAGAPTRNELTSQRDDARAQVVGLTADLATAEDALAATADELDLANGELRTAQSELTNTEASLVSMTESRDAATTRADACTVAATAGKDLVTQWSNIFDDFIDYLNAPWGSAAEATIDTHIDEQFTKMDEQQVALDRAMEDCVG